MTVDERLTRPTTSLTNWDKNPRGIKKDAFERLKKQIQKLGQYKPLLITEDGVVLGGNMRLRAYKELGIKEAWVSVVYPKNEQEMVEYALSDNDRAGYYENEALVELALQYPDLELGDYSVDVGEARSLEDIVAELTPQEVVEDEVPEVSDEEPQSKYGEVYQLGRHRLMCGDSTKIEDVEKLMNGQKADMVFTDPPYNLGYSYNTYKDNKTREEYKSFCVDWFNLLKAFSKEKIIITTGKQNMGLWFEIEEPEEVAVWVHKNGVSGGRVSNLSLWEPIFFYGKYDRSSRVSNLFEYELKRQDTGETGKEHSCPKQVEMIADIVKSYSKENELWLDVFGGSGTTLIACEQLNRTCYMMELDPKYCDVIRKRYEQFKENN